MTDFGSAEERAAALRVALACKELNSAMGDAARIGVAVDVQIVDVQTFGCRSTMPVLQVSMERRTMILPTAIEGA